MTEQTTAKNDGKNPTGPPSPGEGTVDETPEPTPNDADTRADGERDEAALPDWARSELEALRQEADTFRTTVTELRESLAQAKSPDEVEAAAARVAALELELHRERLGRTYNLPEVFAALISGDTEESREEHAKALAESFHQRSVNLGQVGMDPTERQSPTDPAALAGMVPRRRH